MTPEENKRRANDLHVKYIKNHLCDKDGDKSFVFISYKSDDWEIVLHDIVYRLVKDYGLNVYFDGSFDSHAPLWTKQFPENMEDYKCKGVLSFVDDKYASSYATLLELMYSQTMVAKKGVVQINIGKLTARTGAEGARDTGLGVENCADGTINVHAKNEEDLFVETFEQLVDRNILKDSKYLFKKGKTLTKKICSEIVKNMFRYLEVNENPYESPNGDLEGIVGSIKDAFDNDVFSNPNTDDERDALRSNIDESDEEDNGGVDGREPNENQKKKSSGSLYTFQCGDNRFENKKLKEMMLIVFKYVLNRNPENLDMFISELPCLGEGNKIEKKAKPAVFRAGEVVEITGKQISIGTSLNEKSVLDYINKLMEMSGEEDGLFVLEEKRSKDGKTQESEFEIKSKIASKLGSIIGSISLGGKVGSSDRKAAADIYDFELYGKRYEGKKLKELMLEIFKQVMPKHIDKLDELLSLLPCLCEGDRIEKKAKPAVFRAGEVVEIEGRQISIGTSLGRNSVIGYIGKLMIICNEDRENLIIDNYEY